MNIVEKRISLREAAGRRAREEALMLDRLVETMRLASFRSYLAATVCSMSAIVPDVLATAGTDVASALQRIRPGHMWPMKMSSRKTFSRRQAARLSHGRFPAPSFVDPCAVAYLPPLVVGDAIISEGAPGDWIEASILGDSLEITLRSDGYELSTHAGTAHLKLAGALPVTVLAACAGRPLAEVVDHPLLRSGDYVIERAAQVSGSSRLSFNLGQVGLELPWRP
jgi:hypothetical protein